MDKQPNALEDLTAEEHQLLEERKSLERTARGCLLTCALAMGLSLGRGLDFYLAGAGFEQQVETYAGIATIAFAASGIFYVFDILAQGMGENVRRRLGFQDIDPKTFYARNS